MREWGLGLCLLLCMVVVAEETGGSKGASQKGEGELSLRKGKGGGGVEGGGLPSWFDEETMRVVGPDDTLYLGYAAFIPQKPLSNYSAADDENLSLSRRINAGYKLPNTYRPGEWAPIRRLTETPKLEQNVNGVVMSSREKYQPVSWFTIMRTAFGAPGRLPRMGDHMGEDPTEKRGGFNAFMSPVGVASAFNWIFVSLLPANWVLYPYLPWKPWKPWKVSFSDLPSGKTGSLTDYLHHPDLRPAASQVYPWFRPRIKPVSVRAPEDRDRDIASEWPIYSSRVRTFKLRYPRAETVLVLKGAATVACKGVSAVTLTVDDLARIPAGAECEWDVTEPMMMHYMFH